MERKSLEFNPSSLSKQGWEPEVTKFHLIDRLSPTGKQVLRDIENAFKSHLRQKGKAARKMFKNNRRG